MTVRTPTLDRTEWWTSGLPFDSIEELLRGGTTQFGHRILTSPDGSEDPQNMNSIMMVRDGLDTLDWNQYSCMESFGMRERDESIDAETLVQKIYELDTSEIIDFTALKSVLPQSVARKHSPRPFFDLPNTRDLATPQLRQVLFSLANNFAGLDGADMGKISRFLRNETSQRLFQLICSDSKCSSRAIAQSIFKGAIEIGDAWLGDLLLSRKSLGIEVNLLWCYIEGMKYSPIERASELRHKEMIRILLKHGADVNRTYQADFLCNGALDYAVGSSPEAKAGVDPEIFEMLLDAGGDMSPDPLKLLISRREGECASLLMSANAHKNVARWSEWGIFVEAVRFLDDRTALIVIRIMLAIRADLNFCVKGYNELESIPSTIIDAAAQRGSKEMVEILLRSGALMTHETLHLAIMSGNNVLIERLLRSGALATDDALVLAIRSENHVLIRSLLDRGLDVNDRSHDSLPLQGTTPLSEAIRVQSDETIELLERYGALRLDHQYGFSAAISAASEAGNMPFIKRLVQLGGQARAKELGWALAIAIKKGHDEAVTMLIDAGADLNEGDIRSEEPLVEALTRRNTALVHLLLEAGASPDTGEDPLRIAVEWGDLSIVETLILAGAAINDSRNHESALALAVKQRDHALVNLLLDNGADVDGDTKRGGGNILTIAIQSEDFRLARCLLDRGADPVDSMALGNAMIENPQFFDLLLEKHRTRYSAIRPRFGCYALIRAVELGDGHTVRLMLEKGLDAKSLIGATSPFGHAVIKSTLGVIETFLQNGCKPNSIVEERSDYGLRFYKWTQHAEVSYGMTAFLAAIETRNVSKVRLLHKYGADVNFPAHTRVKRTPLQQAAETGSTEIVELLIRLGAEVNAPAARSGGATALQLAAIGGYIPVVCLLLNSQADVNAPAAKLHGRMALEGAAEHGRLDMVQLLLNAGAGNEGKDHGQFERAKALANIEGFSYIADFLEDYLQQRRQRVEPATPADLDNDDLSIGNPNQGIDSIDMAPRDVLMEEDTLLSNEWFDENVVDSGTDLFQTDLFQTDSFQDSF